MHKLKPDDIMRAALLVQKRIAAAHGDVLFAVDSVTIELTPPAHAHLCSLIHKDIDKQLVEMGFDLTFLGDHNGK